MPVSICVTWTILVLNDHPTTTEVVKLQNPEKSLNGTDWLVLLVLAKSRLCQFSGVWRGQNFRVYTRLVVFERGNNLRFCGL